LDQAFNFILLIYFETGSSYVVQAGFMPASAS
jgi:hypothetical protein